MLIAQIGNEHGHGRLEMIADLHGRVNRMGDRFLSYLAVISAEVTRFGERYRNDVKIFGQELRFFFINERICSGTSISKGFRLIFLPLSKQCDRVYK